LEASSEETRIVEGAAEGGGADVDLQMDAVEVAAVPTEVAAVPMEVEVA
jgi:hypothetical protein